MTERTREEDEMFQVGEFLDTHAEHLDGREYDHAVARYHELQGIVAEQRITRASKLKTVEEEQNLNVRMEALGLVRAP